MLRVPSVALRVPSVDAESAKCEADSAEYSAPNIQHLPSVNVESLSITNSAGCGMSQDTRTIFNDPQENFSTANARPFPYTDPRTKI